MINLTGGNVQTLAGVAVPGGSLTLQLNGDAVVIATPGFVPSAYQRTFPFDSTGNLSGSCKLWSNAELNPPGTQYLVTFKDANGSRISNQIWQFTQSSGATVDIGTIIPVAPASSAASLPFSSVLANLIFGGPASGAAAFPSFRSLVAADIPALLNALQQFGATDTGLSRLSAHVLGVGNGTQGDVSGSIEAAIMLMSVIQQITGTSLVIKDSNNGTRFSIPLNGTGQGTINNMALTGAASSNSVTLLSSQDILGNVTGNGTDKILYTFTIPANTVQAGKGVRLKAWVLTNNSVAVSYKVIVGATTLFTVSSSSGAGATVAFTVDMFNNQGTQAAQTYGTLVIDNVTVAASNANATSTENFANAITVSVTANEAASNTVTPRKFILELIQ